VAIISVFVLVFASGIVYLFITSGDNIPATDALPDPIKESTPAPPPVVINGEPLTDSNTPEPDKDQGHRIIEPIPPNTPVGALAGRVLDGNDRPLENAVVALYRTVPTSFLKKRISTKISVETDKKGQYTIRSIPVETGYALLVRAEGFAMAEMDGLAVAPDRTINVADFRLSRGLSLFGTVSDPTGIPLAGVEIQALDKMKEMSGLAPDLYTSATKTDGSGKFTIPCLSQAQYEITFTAQGYRTTTVPWVSFTFSGQAREPDPLHVQLHPSGLAIRGVILSLSERPVPDAKVNAFFTNPRKNATFTGEASSDENGQFVLSGLSEGKYSLRISANGFFQKEHLSVDAGQEGVVVTMLPTGAVEGRLRTAGKTPRSYRITVEKYTPSFRLSEPNRAREMKGGPDPTFIFKNLFPGKYTFLVKADGFAQTRSEEVEVISGQTAKGLEIELLAGGAIKGKLLDPKGKPIPGACVELMDRLYEPTLPFEEIFVIKPEQEKKTATGAGGSFTIPHVRAGEYSLRIDVDKMARKVMKNIIVEEGGSTDLGSIKLSRGGGIKGTAYDENGYVAPGTKVTARSQEAGAYKSVTTDDKGRFLFEYLAPGEYTLTLNLKNIWKALKFDTNVTVYVYDNQISSADIYPRPKEKKQP
jgi:protocatechuate 3,4-dioxygenase beta subunit